MLNPLILIKNKPETSIRSYNRPSTIMININFFFIALFFGLITFSCGKQQADLVTISSFDPFHPTNLNPLCLSANNHKPIQQVSDELLVLTGELEQTIIDFHDRYIPSQINSVLILPNKEDYLPLNISSEQIKKLDLKNNNEVSVYVRPSEYWTFLGKKSKVLTTGTNNIT